MSGSMHKLSVNAEVEISAGDALLDGTLRIPQEATGLVVFVHGSGSSRLSTRNQAVARALNNAGLGTLLFDLLTRQEELVDAAGATLRFDIGFLAKRVLAATYWLKREQRTADLTPGYFGASTGAAAALFAASEQNEHIGAVVSRGGRPDLATKTVLKKVTCPTLLLVGANDHEVIKLNEQAFKHLSCKKEMRIIPAAGHLFEEPGRMEIVSDFASRWFTYHLR